MVRLYFSIRVFYLTLIFLISLSGTGQVILSEWIVSTGNRGWDIVNDMLCDTAGNIYITGSLEDTTGKSKILSNSLLAQKEKYLAKYDTGGKLIWHEQILNNTQGYGSLLALTDKNKILLAGGSVSDQKNGSRSFKRQDFYLTEIDETGKPIWEQQIKGTYLDFLSCLEIDTTGGDIVLAGYFHDTISINGIKTASKGKSDVIILKFDKSGHFLNAISFGGKGEDRPSSISFDRYGNVVIVGTFQRQIRFTKKIQLALSDPAITGAYIARYNRDCECISANLICSARKVSVSNFIETGNKSYLYGSFSDVLSYGGNSLSSKGSDDIFLISFDENLQLLFVKQIGGFGKDRAADLFVARDAEILTGSFCSELKVDNVLIDSTNNSSEVFILSIDTLGGMNWIRKFGGKSDDFPTSITKGGKDYYYVSGSFKVSMDFGDRNIKSNGEEDIFIGRLEDCKALAPNFKHPEKICLNARLTLDAGNSFVYYNWNDGAGHKSTYTVYESGNYPLELLNKDGCRLFDTIIVVENPSPVIFIGNDTIIADTSMIVLNAGTEYTDYTWSNGNTGQFNKIIGLTLPDTINLVWVSGTNPDGCEGYDEILIKLAKSGQNAASELLSENCFVYPNPTDRMITLYSTIPLENVSFTIYNQLGKEIYFSSFDSFEKNTQVHIDLGINPPGLYTILIKTGSGYAVKKIVLI